MIEDFINIHGVMNLRIIWFNLMLKCLTNNFLI
jgi:hypothetical protein